MIVELDSLVIESEPTGTIKLKLQDFADWFSPALMDAPALKIPLSDGFVNPGRTYRDGKRMNLVGFAYGGTAEEAEELAWEELASISTDGRVVALKVTTGRGERNMKVFVDGKIQVIPFGPNRARFKIPLMAPDPRKYGPSVTSIAGAAGTADDGLTFPLFADGYLDFGVFSPSGLFYLTNNGKAESWPTFKARGGIVDGFEIISAGKQLNYNASVAVGVEVFLSPYIGGRASIGTSDVSNNLEVLGWPSVLPGETRLFVFNPIGAADANAQLTYTFSEAWW